jgi:imidazolonepropionase-like amidohydrolase
VPVLHNHGVPILVGTDLGSWYIYAGFSVHDEMELLVEEGRLSPLTVLQAATLNPATYLGARDSLGTVDVGKIADLVILDANPLQAIENTRRIHAVVLGGRFFDRRALDQMLAKVAELVRN